MNRPVTFAALALLATAVACSTGSGTSRRTASHRATAPAPVTAAPAVNPAPPVTSTPAQSPGPLPPASGAPTPAQVATPLPAPTPKPPPEAVPMLPPNAPPKILAISISTPVASGGDVVSGSVRTSSNVASVVAKVANIQMGLRKVGVGHFTLTYTVPQLPFFLHRTWTIQVIAYNTRGAAARGSIPITIR